MCGVAYWKTMATSRSKTRSRFYPVTDLILRWSFQPGDDVEQVDFRNRMAQHRTNCRH
jgi:hypothetical protein